MTDLTTGDVARRAGLSKPSIVRAVKAGKLNISFNTPGNHRRFAIDEVERFIHSLRPSLRSSLGMGYVDPDDVPLEMGSIVSGMAVKPA